MRADAVDLDFFGNRLRVLCADPGAAATLRAALDAHLIDEPAPLGFSLRLAPVGNQLHVLIDRSGLVLARFRSIDHGISVLRSHLAALLPPPAGTVRLRGRALVGSGGRVVLAGFPLFVDPPVVERRLERMKFRLVDRLVIDVRLDGSLEMAPAPWPEFGELPVTGHTPAPRGVMPIVKVLVPKTPGPPPSTAMIVAYLAGSTCSGSSVADRLTLAETLARKPTETISTENRSDRYTALKP